MHAAQIPFVDTDDSGEPDTNVQVRARHCPDPGRSCALCCTVSSQGPARPRTVTLSLFPFDNLAGHSQASH